MPKRIFQLLLIACLVTGTSWAASDPLVGKWKLNSSKSTLTDEMKVASAGANRFAFDFGGGPETIVADGTDQPGHSATTLSVTVEGPDHWKVVRKKDGRMLLTANWTLSQDGSKLSDDFTGYQANGSTYNVLYVYKRTAGSSGFTGAWESVSEQVNSTVELQIEPYEGDGLSFIYPAQEETDSMKFDGKDYAKQGPNVAQGSAWSGRRVNDRTVEVTVKSAGKVVGTQRIMVSPDSNILTMTVQPAGHSKPTIRVFDRE